MIYKAKELRNKKIAELRSKVSQLERKPFLAVVSVGNDDANSIYIRNKIKASNEVGINTAVLSLGEDCSQEELNSLLSSLSSNSNVDAIILQLPIPKHLNKYEAILNIDPSKDADCLTIVNHGMLYQFDSVIKPCTPAGIMDIIDDIGFDLKGKIATVIGRSMLVGQPVAKMLQDRGTTVTICHSSTDRTVLSNYTKQSDIVICAVGIPNFLGINDINDDTLVVDVGINRLDGKIVGDVDKNIEKDNKNIILTSVPGGVGLMTVESLMENVYELYCDRI